MYITKLMLIDWLNSPELALFVYCGISNLTYYMPRNVGLSTSIAIVCFSQDHCSFKLVLTTLMITYIHRTE